MEQWNEKRRTPELRRAAERLCRTAFFGMVLLMLSPALLIAQGGCGSVCIPLDVLDPARAQLEDQQLRISLTTQSGRFDNFRAGDEDIDNPGGNQAIIEDLTLFIDYGISERWTAALMVPYIRKIQQTNRFGRRVAEGLGDVAIFGRYQLLAPQEANRPSVSVGLGLKFPTGDIDEPGTGQPRLPPAFQAGSGAHDLVPTLSYFQAFPRVALFGSSFWRIPLEDNELGYRFGDEIEAHFGAVVPLPVWKGRLEFVVSADYLHAEHDEDRRRVLPGRLRDGARVLNTGGNFLDLAPGLRLRLTPDLTVQARFFVAVVEDWNGVASRNVGQVAPDVTSQLSFFWVK